MVRLSRPERRQQGAVLRLCPPAAQRHSEPLPERFLLLDKRHIETKPIKGTRPRHPDPAQDARVAESLASADKDRSENLMIVDLLRNDIGRVSRPGSVTVPHLFAVESFPAVHHLVSTIHGELDARWQEVDLLRACFPGGSITGAPKIRAMEIIEELEPVRRNAYCGSIGYLSQHGRMDTSICIRTLIAEAGQLHCWAGAASSPTPIPTPNIRRPTTRWPASCHCSMPFDPIRPCGADTRRPMEMTSAELLTRFLLQRPPPPIAWHWPGSNLPPC